MSSSVKKWLGIVITFIVVLYFYAYISYFGVKDYLKEGVLKEYLDSNLWHIELITTGIILGSYFILINRITDRPSLRKKSYGFNILLKSGLYLLSLIFVSIFIYYFFLLAGLANPHQMETYKDLFSGQFAVGFVLFYAVVILLFNFMIYINAKFGPGILWDLITGKYHHPRSEELIFLFLDLKGSTRLNEIFGHKKYSSFLKECIHELTPIINKYQANIYQYVGDEVVLFWQKGLGIIKLQCIDLFFEFNQSLEKKSEYFLKKYGYVPRFKAGMDVGIVTATEIGDIKREIAYHGDTLNIASRLEGKCNEYEAQLIISQHIKDQSPVNKKYRFQLLSDFPLRGKEKCLQFYKVSPN